MNKQTKYNHNAIMRLYNAYFNLCSKQDYDNMCLVYNLITSIALEDATSHSKGF